MQGLGRGGSGKFVLETADDEPWVAGQFGGALRGEQLLRAVEMAKAMLARR